MMRWVARAAQAVGRGCVASGCRSSGSVAAGKKPWAPSKETRPRRSPFGSRPQPQPFAALLRQQSDGGAAAEGESGGQASAHAPSAGETQAAATRAPTAGSTALASARAEEVVRESAAKSRRSAAAADATTTKGGSRPGEPRKRPTGREPECRLATLIRTVPEANAAVEYLSQRKLEKNIFAVDTETEGIDPTAQSPVGNGLIVCFSVYCGPSVDFSPFGQTLDLSHVTSHVAASAKIAAAQDHQASGAAPSKASVADSSKGEVSTCGSSALGSPAESDVASLGAAVAPPRMAAAVDVASASTLAESAGLAHPLPETDDRRRDSALGKVKDKKGSVAVSKSRRLWVDTAGEEGEAIMQVFKGWLENAKFKKVFHNWSFDSHMFANHGVVVKGFAGDTMHMARLWDSSRTQLSGGGGYKLSALCHDLLGWGKTDMKLVFGRAKLKADGTPGKAVFLPGSLSLQTDDDQEVFLRWVHYSTYDSLCTYYLYFMLRKELEMTDWQPDAVMSAAASPLAPPRGTLRDPSQRPVEPGAKLRSSVAGVGMAKERNLWHFYERCWKPFGEILAAIERNGVFVDTEHLLQQAECAERDKLQKEDVFRKWVAKICPDGSYINARSVTQKRHLLFSSSSVEILKDIKLNKTKKWLKAGDTIELAYRDAQELIASKAARAVPPPSGGPIVDPDMKTFTVENKEKLLEAGRATPKATREISLRGLQLRPVAYTATGAPSTSGAVIAQLAGKPYAEPPQYGTAYEDLGGGQKGKEACEALGALIESESIDKLLSTFLRTLPKMADQNSRIHTALNLNTETGRLSSMRPNLQNQPALEKDVYGVRRAFSAQPGNKLIVVDYGQLELRIMAHMTRCKSMLDAFALGGDFHSRTAIDMYPHVKAAVDRQEVLLEWNKADGVAPAPMLKDTFGSERRKAKTLNFSIAYGKTKTGLAKDWGVGVDEAEETILAWYDARKEVKEWQDQVKVKARKTGYAETLLGRKRKLPGMTSGDVVVRGHAERAAINTPIQGGAADVVTMAMINLFKNQPLRHMGWRMVLQVHDEIILEGPADGAAEAYVIIKECMEHPFAPRQLSVALPVDGAICDNWYQAK